MTRLAAVILLSIAMLAALWSVRDFDPSLQPSDEILAYEVTQQSAVSVSIPGGVDRVLITTWLTVPIGASDTDHTYGIKGELFAFDGKPLAERVFSTRSRVSDVPDGASLPAARLADASSWVCQPRSFELPVSELVRKAGILRVSLSPTSGPSARVLLRLTHAVERGEIERRLVERALSAREIERIMARRSSLGFFDIPLERRMDALSTWERRLTAQGRAGRDYFTRRLLLGGAEGGGDHEAWRAPGHWTSKERRLALNLEGSAELRVSAEPGTVVLLRDGMEEPSSHVVTASGYVDLSLPEGELRSVEVYSEELRELALSSPRGAEWRWVTSRSARVIADRYEVVPDFRRQTHYSLDRSEPVVLEMPKTQRTVGLSVRSVVDDESSAQQATVAATWRDAEGQAVSTARHASVLERSSFETAGEQAVTEQSVARLLVPEGAVRLELFGSTDTIVAPFVDEPGVLDPKPLPPYDRQPPETMAWRNEPWETAPVAAVAPDNVEALRRGQRVVSVVRQVRLEPLSGLGETIAERVLEPASAPTTRALLRPAHFLVGSAFPSNGWVWVPPGERSVRLEVPDHGSVPFIYLTDPRALGGRFVLSADGEAVLQQPVVVTDAQGVVELPTGPADFSFTGLGAEGVLLLKAPPVQPATVVKRQRVYRLERGRSLAFPFYRRAGELLSISILVASGAEGDRSLRVTHRVDGGQLETHQAFFRRSTEANGTHELSGPPVARGFVWTRGQNRKIAADADALHRLVIRLGDDLSVGQHKVEIAVPHRALVSAVWIRAVLVGSLIPPTEGGRAR